MAAWLSPRTAPQARMFAKWSALGSLALGMLGQVAYHLLAAAHRTRAPWPVVVVVACLPVVTLGFGAALAHLLAHDDTATSADETAQPDPLPVLLDTPTDTRSEQALHLVPVDAESAALIAFKATLAAGNPLSQNKLMEKFGLTRAAAQRVRKQAIAELGSTDDDTAPATAAA